MQTLCHPFLLLGMSIDQQLLIFAMLSLFSYNNECISIYHENVMPQTHIIHEAHLQIYSTKMLHLVKLMFTNVSEPLGLLSIGLCSDNFLKETPVRYPNQIPKPS